jgi:microcystin-dependent protein
LLPISQNTALFSLLGTFYGGDGRSTFALPNLQGQAPVNQGQGAGLSLRDIGESGGAQTATLIDSEMPSHNHAVNAFNAGGDQTNPANTVWGSAMVGRQGTNLYKTAPIAQAQMSPAALNIAGGSQPHNNMPPFLTLTFIIAMQGIFPSRS